MSRAKDGLLLHLAAVVVVVCVLIAGDGGPGGSGGVQAYILPPSYPSMVSYTSFYRNRPIPASSLFIFVLFTLQFKFKWKKQSVDDVLGIRTQGRTMVAADGSIERWRPHELDPF